jgi:hypothetical protein
LVYITYPNQPPNLSRPVVAKAPGEPGEGEVAQSETDIPTPVLAPAGSQAASAAPVASSASAAASATPSFLSSLSTTDKALFGAYLTYTLFPALHGCAFPQMPEVSIFDVFDEVELRYYYRQWKNTPVTHSKVPGYAPAPASPPYPYSGYTNSVGAGYNYYPTPAPTQPPLGGGGYGYGGLGQ